MKAAQKRQRLVLGHPEVARSATRAFVATFLMLFLFFGMEFLHLIFESAAGISVLSGVRTFLNESLAVRLGLLVGWGIVIFDFALTGGIAVVSAPFHRFAGHMDQVPARLLPFRPRATDFEFRRVAHSYNAMVDRLLAAREAVLTILETADHNGRSIGDVRQEIESYMNSAGAPQLNEITPKATVRRSEHKLRRLIRRSTGPRRQM